MNAFLKWVQTAQGAAASLALLIPITRMLYLQHAYPNERTFLLKDHETLQVMDHGILTDWQKRSKYHGKSIVWHILHHY